MKNYYTVVTNDDKFASTNMGYLTVGYGVAEKNKKRTRQEAIQFLDAIEAAKLKSIYQAEEYIGRRKNSYRSIKLTFQRELKMLNEVAFRIVYVSFRDIA